MFKSINSESVAEIMEKKSKFIATLCEANSKDEAEKILQETRKKYHDAKHNCYAYIVQKLKNAVMMERHQALQERQCLHS